MKERLFFTLIGLISLMPVFAQQDITDTFLTNAGFNSNFNYPIGYTGSVTSTNPGTMRSVTGWTSGPVIDWSVTGTYEYGWTGRFNDAAVPTSGYDEATGPGEGALGLSVGWGNSLYYTQNVTLPAGIYAIEFAMCLRGGNSIQNNLTGWVPNSGTAVLSPIRTVDTDDWVIGTVEFTLSEETVGKIRIGMQANGGATSTAMARMFIDDVKLIYYDDLDVLLIELKEQKALAQTNVSIDGPGVYNTDELNTAIANADAIDLENTTESELVLAIDMLKAANENAAAVMQVYAPLKEALNNATLYAETTYYPGRSDLEEAIAAARVVYDSADDQSSNISSTIEALSQAVSIYQSTGSVEITEDYLTNPGFNQNCNYKTGGTQTVGTTNPGTLGNVTGWTYDSAPAWSVAGTFEYGWAGDFNGVSAPAAGSDGATGSGQGAMGISVGWGGSIVYTQAVTLEAGKYSIEFAVNFQGADNINNNLIGWVPSEGAAVLSDMTTASTGEWTIGEVTFTATEQTTGDIQVGMQAYGSTSSSNSRLFIDYVKLLKYSNDKTNLEALVDSAAMMLASQENVPEGSTAYTDLETEHASAQIVLDNSRASDEEILSAENAMKMAIVNVHAAILAYNVAGATVDNPIDLSYKIFNPDFELNGGSTDGWITTLGIFNGPNASFDGAPVPNHVLDGVGFATTVGYQTVSGLPAGVYRVKAIARGRVETNAHMFLGAEAGKTFGSPEAHRVSTQIDRIGDIGGELNYGFNQYETPLLVLEEGEIAVTLGIYFDNDCGWSSADNFELYYYGTTEKVVNSLKNNLIALKDSTNIPTGYDLTEANALVNTVLTDENAITLIAGLEETIASLEKDIAANIDASLSDLKVNGKSIKNFSPSVYEYLYNIHTTSPDMPTTPAVTAIKNSSYAEEPEISDAEEIPGTTSITVTAGNGQTQTYTINFDAVLLTELENNTVTLETLENVFYELSGVGQLTITGSDDPLNGSLLDLKSIDTWIYFPNIKPSQVVSNQLSSIKVNGEDAVESVNIRVTQYLNGAMVIPHSSTYQPLTVYSGKNLGGESRSLGINNYYKTSQLGDMNDDIESFKLKKGYMATFASNQNGTGTSRVYIADKNDITVKTMPSGLSNSVSFIIVRKWRWTTKKAWRGSAAGADRFGATSHYDYNNAARSTLDVEYIPMRHNPGWNAYSNFLNQFESTHALGYNEPDNSVDDGYSTVADAIANWPRMMESGLRLGTPATTDGGLWWLYDFLDQCKARNYRVDFIAWHYYRRGNSTTNYYNALRDIHNRTGMPIWITEFNNGCNWTYDNSNPVPSIERNGEVIESFIHMLDTAHFVERYFVWDGCNENLRMTNSATGELYPAGIAYRDQVSTMAYTEDFYNSNSLGGTIIQENSEGFCNIDGTIDNNHDGYTGSGFANADNAEGSGIEWKVVFPADGAKTFTFRYAMHNDRAVNLYINDELVADSIIFPATPSLSQWVKLPVMAYANAGIAAVRLEGATGEGLPNIDYMQVTEVSATDCDASIHTVTLTVKDGEELIEGATVSINSNEFVTDANGTVTIEYVNNGDYGFTVTADGFKDYNGNITVNEADVTKDVAMTNTVGINDNFVTELKIYPNPASKFVTVDANSEISDIKVYDNYGRLVLMHSNGKRNNQEQIDISRLVPGMYHLQCIVDNTLHTEKLIIK
ncbi:glycosyl hydrolase [Maribellus mangrovi]|uniref:glycosyl hydrolase n=1 Tax=Maribellus mangrovi TaxID=3133146 RepID=UPI0030EE6AA5